MLAEEESFAGLASLNRALIRKAEEIDSGWRAVLDMDSREIPVYGQQEQSDYNGYFESVCYHPLLLVAAGRESFEAAPVRGDAAADRIADLANWVDEPSTGRN